MKVLDAQISELSFDPANARKHSPRNIEAIKGSLSRFGQQKPIVVDSNMVVRAGNGTLEAAKLLGWQTIKVHKSDLPPAELTAFALADNKTSELAEWDDEVLEQTLKSLAEMDIDATEFGFDYEADLGGGTEGKTDPDEVPEVEENIHGVERGQIWLLGEHRLMCGDSTDKADVDRLMAGEKADMVFTDPPYGVSERTMRKSAGRGNLVESQDFRPVIGDDSIDTAVKCFELCKGMPGIWWGANYYAHHIPQVKSWLVWDKRGDVPSDDNADCELAWVWNNKPARVFKHLWKGCIRESEKKEAKVHPTQKPIALAEWCFENYGKPKSVLDLFLGSGSTLIACEKTGRKCYGMEIDPHYCSVIIERWQNFTGKEASLEES